MKYEVVINKKFAYVRTYKILKSVNQNTNVLSKFVQNLVDKYIEKKQSI